MTADMVIGLVFGVVFVSFCFHYYFSIIKERDDVFLGNLGVGELFRWYVIWFLVISLVIVLFTVEVYSDIDRLAVIMVGVLVLLLMRKGSALGNVNEFRERCGKLNDRLDRLIEECD